MLPSKLKLSHEDAQRIIYRSEVLTFRPVVCACSAWTMRYLVTFQPPPRKGPDGHMMAMGSVVLGDIRDGKTAGSWFFYRYYPERKPAAGNPFAQGAVHCDIPTHILELVSKYAHLRGFNLTGTEGHTNG